MKQISKGWRDTPFALQQTCTNCYAVYVIEEEDFKIILTSDATTSLWWNCPECEARHQVTGVPPVVRSRLLVKALVEKYGKPEE